MKTEEPFYKIFMRLHNNIILEYAQIARSGPKYMIPDIEGLSNLYRLKDGELCHGQIKEIIYLCYGVAIYLF